MAALVGSPFGLKGFVKIRSLSGETGHLARLKQVCLRQGDKEKVLEVEETAPAAASALLMKFAGIDSPEEAKTLKGAEILTRRFQAAPLKEGEFYIEDLKGLAVLSPCEDSSGLVRGHIADVLEGGGGFLAEIRLPSGERKFVPFRKEFFGDIDIDSKTAVLLETWILDDEPLGSSK